MRVSCEDLGVGRLPRPHYIVEQPDRDSTKRPRNFPAAALATGEPFRFRDITRIYESMPRRSLATTRKNHVSRNRLHSSKKCPHDPFRTQELDRGDTIRARVPAATLSMPSLEVLESVAPKGEWTAPAAQEISIAM